MERGSFARHRITIKDARTANMAFAKWLPRQVNDLSLVVCLHIFNRTEGMLFQPLRKRLNR